MRDRILGRLGLLGAAAVGAIVGHCSTYMLAMWGRGGRDALLAETGQGYWHLTLGTALIIGVWMAGAVFLHFFRARRAPRAPSETLGFWSLTLRLAALQLLLFTSVEVGEHLIGPNALDASLFRKVLSLGVGVQGLVALAIAVLLRLLVRAAEALAELFAVRPRHATAPAFPLPPPDAVRPVPVLAGGVGVRGPPSFG